MRPIENTIHSVTKNISDFLDQSIRPIFDNVCKETTIIDGAPSETSCNQDLGQDTRYRNVSRSWKNGYKIFQLSCTKICI